MVEAEIIEWFVAVGDQVQLDQTICSIETDKSVVDMTTPFAGIVVELGAARGGVVEVGQPLIVVGSADEVRAGSSPLEAPAATPPPADLPAAEVDAAGPQDASPQVAGDVRSPLLRKLATDLGIDTATIVGSGHGGQITRADIENAASSNAVSGAAAAPPLPDPRSGSIKAMPKVRLTARQAGIDLGEVPGSGPDGIITLADLHRWPSATARGERRERISSLRRAIGAHLTESTTTIPQFTSMVDVDVTGVLATRAALRARHDAPVSIDAVIMALLIPVLRDHPRINARFDDDASEIVYFDRYDIGVAVDTPDGLIVPVVTGANHRPVEDLAAEIVRLAEVARSRTIQPSELSGATCTLNNVGAVGLQAGTPILPVGTTAIIAPGQARPQIRLHNGNPVEVMTMTISATFDHRVVDGGDAGRFLTQLRDHLEVPALGLL